MAAAREEGIFEIEITDANDQFSAVVYTVNTEVDMPASAETDITKRQWLPYGIGGGGALGDSIPEYGKLKLYFTPVSTDNVVYSSSKINIPVTKINLAIPGGNVFSDVITAKNFDDWLAAGTTGIACTAGKRTLLGEYQLGAKLAMKLGNKTAEGLDKNNARLLMVAYDDTV